MKEKTYEAIIVGGGPAGLAAGLYCQRAALKTVLFEKGLLGGQIAISKDVENYPGLEGITGFDLAEKLVHHAQAFGLSIVQEEVAEVKAGQDLHTVRLAGGDVYRTSALILAAGGCANKLGVPGEAEYQGTGVSYCATCDGFFFKEKTVVVIGGGDTAVEEALYLAKLKSTVHLVHRRDELRASRILQERLMNNPRIHVIWNTIVTEIKGDDTVVTSVALENTGTGEKGELAADGVFIFIGYSPNDQLIPPEVRKNEYGYVITDETCHTNVPGIFAVGDCRGRRVRGRAGRGEVHRGEGGGEGAVLIAGGEGKEATGGPRHPCESFREREKRFPSALPPGLLTTTDGKKNRVPRQL
jgi:thioredoxin reductase (NADPH)